MTKLQPCPQCKASAIRREIRFGDPSNEVIECSVGCGYPKIHPHVRTEWLKDYGWNDLAAMWNSCRIEKNPTSGEQALVWGNGQNYQKPLPQQEFIGPYNIWSVEISKQKISGVAA